MSEQLTYRTWESAFQELRLALTRAQEERWKRDRWTQDGELEWVAYERNVMTEKTNMLRSRLGLAPVSIDAIRRVEDLACGHIDYTAKYAIGCADLVTTTDPLEDR